MNILLYLTSSSYRKHRWARKKLIELRRNPLWYEMCKEHWGMRWGTTITIPKIKPLTAKELLK